MRLILLVSVISFMVGCSTGPTKKAPCNGYKMSLTTVNHDNNSCVG